MTLNRDSNDPGRMAYGFDVGLLQSHRRLMHTSPHRILKHSVFDDAGIGATFCVAAAYEGAYAVGDGSLPAV